MRLLFGCLLPLFLLRSGAAEAACVISDVQPTAVLPNMMRPAVTFSFVATHDCATVAFATFRPSVFTKVPTPGDVVGPGQRRFKVVITPEEWSSLTPPRVKTFVWTASGTTVDGTVTHVTTTNEIDSDHDGWTRTDGDVGACDFMPARNPGVVDVRGNGVDDDCDGGVDNTRFEDPAAEILAPTSYRPAVGDLDADGVADFAFGSTSDQGHVYVVYGPTHGSLSAFDFPALVTGTSDYIGQSVSIGDADGDGIDDLATVNYLGDRTYLLLGPVTGERHVARADAFFDVPDSGSDLDIVPDFDGDGTGDVVVGAPDSRSYEGAVYVGSGGASGTVDLETSATYTFLGSDVGRGLGIYDFAIGDATGDGITDLALVGGGSLGGIVYLMEGGTPAGTYEADSAAWATITDAGGRGLASGDYDGDGALDVITGDPDASDAGAAYAFLGPFSGTTGANDAVGTWTGLDYLDFVGDDVAAGDVDGDGSLDVLIGAPYADSSSGAAYLQLGFVSGSVSVSTLPTFSPYGAGDPSNAGAYVNVIPDWEGDGGAEVAISSGRGGEAVVYESGALF